MATYEDLKEVLKESLQAKGVINKVKANIRSEIFKSIDDEDQEKPKLSYENLIVNELIREYLYYLKNFISDVEDGDRYVRLPFTTKENVKIIYDQLLNDKFFKLQDGMMENISGDIQYINFELMN